MILIALKGENAGKCDKCKAEVLYDTINLRLISKPHAYLQTVTKTPVKFPKNRYKTVGGVATTWYPLSSHIVIDNARKMAKFNLQKKATKNNLRIISKPHTYFQAMIKTPVKFQNNRYKTV